MEIDTWRLRLLHEFYRIIADDHAMVACLEATPALYCLLIEAVHPLQQAFGEQHLMHVRILSSGEEPLLKVVAELPVDYGSDPDHALRSFDDQWWIHNCHRADGRLVFDYETAQPQGRV
jgi:hypothetical protein